MMLEKQSKQMTIDDKLKNTRKRKQDILEKIKKK
jgi:hypothetical protein